MTFDYKKEYKEFYLPPKKTRHYRYTGNELYCCKGKGQSK